MPTFDFLYKKLKRTVVLYNCDSYDWKNVDNSINNASKLSVLKVNHLDVLSFLVHYKVQLSLKL